MTETKNEGAGGASRSDAGLALLPCAHCGATAGLHQQKGEDGGWFIECSNARCWMTTPLKYALMDDVAPLLAEIWNRRAN